MCFSIGLCLSLSVHLSLSFNNLTILITLFSIMRTPPNLSAFFFWPSPFAPLTFRSRHWRQSEFDYVEYCQEQEAPDADSLFLSHSHTVALSDVLILQSLQYFCSCFSPFTVFHYPLIFSPHLLVSLSLNAAGGQGDAHKWSCQWVFCDDNDDEWHGWWLARLPGQIWPNVRQTAPVGYRTAVLYCVRKACQVNTDSFWVTNFVTTCWYSAVCLVMRTDMITKLPYYFALKWSQDFLTCVRKCQLTVFILSWQFITCT